MTSPFHLVSRSETARSRDAAQTCLPPCSKRLIPHCGKRIRCCRSAAEVSWKRCVDVFVRGSPGAGHDDDDEDDGGDLEGCDEEDEDDDDILMVVGMNMMMMMML